MQSKAIFYNLYFVECLHYLKKPSLKANQPCWFIGEEAWSQSEGSHSFAQIANLAALLNVIFLRHTLVGVCMCSLIPPTTLLLARQGKLFWRPYIVKSHFCECSRATLQSHGMPRAASVRLYTVFPHNHMKFLSLFFLVYFSFLAFHTAKQECYHNCFNIFYLFIYLIFFPLSQTMKTHVLE